MYLQVDGNLHGQGMLRGEQVVHGIHDQIKGPDLRTRSKFLSLCIVVLS